MKYAKGTEAVYVRQSIDKKDSLSIESQIDKCKALSLYPQDVEIYSDKGFSGKNINRPEFSRLMQDVKSGIIKRVIVYKLDRLSRSTLDFGVLMETFRKYDVDFTSISETFDTSTPIGQAMLQIVMVFAELERKTIQSRITDNYYERAKRGLFLGGPAPYGFNNIRETGSDGKRFSNLQINTIKAEIVSRIFSIYAENEKTSLAKISNILNAENISSPNDGKWDSGKISRILRNPSYVIADANVYAYYQSKGVQITNNIEEFSAEFACYLYGKRESNERKYTKTENQFLSVARHKGFINAEGWLACQHKLDKNSQIKNSGRGTHSWLSGLTKCGKCGYGMTVSKYKDYKYFICRGKHNLKNCDGQTITQYVTNIEQYICSELKLKLLTIPNIEKLSKPINFIANNEIAIKIIKIDDQIKNIVNSISVLDGESVDILGKKLNELAQQKNELEQELSKNQKQELINNPFEKILSLCQNFDNATFEEKKLVAKTLITKILIDDNKITIEWKI